jgi:hypothetical protein
MSKKFGNVSAKMKSLPKGWGKRMPSLIDITNDDELMERVLKKSAEMQEETLKKAEEGQCQTKK